MARHALLLVAFLFALVAVLLAATGGFVATILGQRVSARSPSDPAIAAAVLVAVWAWLAMRAREARDDLARIESWLDVHVSAIVLTIAGLAAAVALRFGTYSAAGSDASGYLSQAEMLAGWRLMRPEPLASLADWTDAAVTLAPLGWRPALEAGWQVPTYAAGLPLAIAPLSALGGPSVAALIVAFSLFVAVVAIGALALRLAGARAAVLASLWFATSPVALAHAMQPMSDVPATAAWLVCWTVLLPRDSGPRWALAGGLAAAAAVLLRPNLAPLALLPALWLLARGDFKPRGAWRRVGAFAAPVAAAGLVVGYLQWRWFGSPWRSGYGTAVEIYALANVAPNAGLYARWLIDTHGPWLLLAPVAAIWPGPAQPTADARFPRRAIRWLLAFAALVVIAYLFYAVFEVWTYLRFLLPALAAAMLAVATVAAAVMARLGESARVPVFAAIVLALAGSSIASARSHDVFRLPARHSRAALAGHYLNAALPGGAVVIAGEQSGSMRYYTGRSIVRWDGIAPEAFEAAVDWLQRDGREIWIVLDAWEEEPFRQRLAGRPGATLDWPPRLEAGQEIVTRAWRLADRDRFLQDERVVTDRLR